MDTFPSNFSIWMLMIVSIFLGSTFGQLWPNYPEPGPDIYGSFCAVRRGGCCPGRVDDCTTPILDTVCYCDEFCIRSQADCCPDYSKTCMKKPTEPAVKNNCNHGGYQYKLGDEIKVNCNNCSCVETRLPTPEYNWKCTQKICVVREELLSHINDQSTNYGWRASNYSMFWGMTLDDGIKYRLGTFKPSSHVLQMSPLRMRVISGLPDRFDARENWPTFIHPIVDQGQCGASWAVSTAGMASDRLAIHSRGLYNDPLSAQQILDCDLAPDQKGCEGGHLDRAWWYLRHDGVVSSECYRYKSDVTQVRGECRISAAAMRSKQPACPDGYYGQTSSVYQMAPPYRISPSEADIMKEIMDNGPVQALMHVKEDFFLYKSGVYRHSSPENYTTPNRHQTGYHSVNIIGWGTDYSAGRGVKYWLCSNSWGTRWGENGYFRILRAVMESEIESFVVGIWAKVNGQELRLHTLRHARRRLHYLSRRHRRKRHLAGS